MIGLSALLLALPAAQLRPDHRPARPDRAAPPVCERCEPRAAVRPVFRPRLRFLLCTDPQLRAELRGLLRERALERRPFRCPLLRT